MAILELVRPSIRRTMNVFFVVDASERVGSSISLLNGYVLDETIRIFKKKMINSEDCEVKVAILQYGQCNWLTSDEEPISIDEYDAAELPKVGMKGLNDALYELNGKLNEDTFLNSRIGSYPPVIIFIGSGNVSENIEDGLECIWMNNWYKYSLKIFIKTDIMAEDDSIINRLTGNPETLFSVDQMSSFERIFLSYIIFAS